MPNSVRITDFLTPEEIQVAITMHRALERQGIWGTRGFARSFATQVIQPNIDRINKALGQENDPMYWAYMVEYILNQVPKV